jgi:hypothetical protein
MLNPSGVEGSVIKHQPTLPSQARIYLFHPHTLCDYSGSITIGIGGTVARFSFILLFFWLLNAEV